VTNPLNYILLQSGANAAYDTANCQAFATHGNLPLGDDIRIPTGSVAYENHGGTGPFVSTVQFNGGTALPNGDYRLLICGTTSIVDLVGNALNNGSDTQVNFTVLVMSSVTSNPQTGFAPDRITVLPEQPAQAAYTDLGNLWIEIPAMQLKTTITGIQLNKGGWDLTWLNHQVGWLDGTAYPTWTGNSVLTAHAYTADGLPGPFAKLGSLAYNDTIIVHLDGMRYIYALQTNDLVDAKDTSAITRHEDKQWLTLITCQQYDEPSGGYLYRWVVRAVLVKIEQDDE
jgi:LPXTG-site transpeptidase (sortase) family protein